MGLALRRCVLHCCVLRCVTVHAIAHPILSVWNRGNNNGSSLNEDLVDTDDEDEDDEEEEWRPRKRPRVVTNSERIPPLRRRRNKRPTSLSDLPEDDAQEEAEAGELHAQGESKANDTVVAPVPQEDTTANIAPANAEAAPQEPRSHTSFLTFTREMKRVNCFTSFLRYLPLTTPEK